MPWDVKRDYYADLGLNAGASPSKIKSQYKKLYLKYHPDKNIGHEADVTEKFLAISAAKDVLVSPPQKKCYDAARLEAVKGAGKPGPRTPPRQTRPRPQTTPRATPRHQSTPRETEGSRQDTVSPQATNPRRPTTHRQTTAHLRPSARAQTAAPRPRAPVAYTYEAFTKPVKDASLQENLGARLAWLLQNFGYAESPYDTPVILKSLRAHERALLHLATQSYGHNLFSRSVTITRGERWTFVGNRDAVINFSKLMKKTDSKEEQIELEERKRVHDEGYEALVDDWNVSNETEWDIQGTWEITCPEIGKSHSSKLLCSMKLFVEDFEDDSSDEKMIWANFDFGSHIGRAHFLCPGSKRNHWVPPEMLPGPASRDWLFRWRKEGDVLDEKAVCSLRFKGAAGLKLEGRWNGGEWFEGRKIAEKSWGR